MLQYAMRALIAAALVAVATPATAAFHLMKVREFFPGTTLQPDVEYVMLQMFQGGQTQIQGHSITFYGPSGSPSAGIVFDADAMNGANQSYILIATTQAQTFFSITADFFMPPNSIDPAGGKICFDDLDCVSWGAFAGSPISPSPSGSPFAPNGGLLAGHAVRRDISQGNGALLEDSDDSDDSLADLDCAATATPVNNAGSSGTPYTDATPCPVCGNNTVEQGEVCDGSDDAMCPGGCLAECVCPTHDAVVLPLKPIKLKVPSDAPMSVSKKVKIKIRNGDSHSGTDSITLSASTGDCPPGVSVSTPDFAPPALNPTISLEAGESAKAVAVVTVTEAAFTTFNSKAQKRCTLQFSAATNVLGNADPRPSNDATPLEINVFDGNDMETPSMGVHESHILSLKPMKVTIGDGVTATPKSVKPALGNADILPAPDSGDALSLSVDVSACVGVTVDQIDANKAVAGDQSSVLVDGGSFGKGLVVVSAHAAGISTPNAASPQRCIAVVTVTGPSDPDPDTTNNDTRLVIDIVDKNDL